MSNIVIPDGGNIGSSSDPDAISIASNGKPTFSQGIANTGTIDAGTIGGNVVFPSPDSGAFGSHVLQVGNGIFTPGGDIGMVATAEAFGPVISMDMHNANAKVIAILVMSEMNSSSTASLTLSLVYKNSTSGTLSAGNGTSSHGGTVLTTYQQVLRIYEEGPGTVVLGGTLSNSAGDTIQFASEGVTSSGTKIVNNAGATARITLTVFELQT